MEQSKAIQFSVIVLAYQVGDYLRQCLDTILCQTYLNYEVILVNPASTDDTDAICAEYAEKYPQVHRLCAENRGQLLNRVAGFQAARGDYLLCVDGDDLWKPNLLEVVAERLQEKPAELAIFGYRSFRGTEELNVVCGTFPDRALYCTEEEKKPVYDRLFLGGPINEMWAKVIARDAFQRIDVDFEALSDVRVAEDWLYSFYLVHEARSILYIDAVLYEYRIRMGSVMRSFRTTELEERIKVYAKVQELMYEYGLNTQENMGYLLATISRGVADWIFRCTVAHVPYSEKKREYEILRSSWLFPHIQQMLLSEKMWVLHRPFVRLYMRSYPMLQVYSFFFRVFRYLGRTGKKLLGTGV